MSEYFPQDEEILVRITSKITASHLRLAPVFDKQCGISRLKGLWLNSYAGSNTDEYFAELAMWYFDTHVDLQVNGAKPANRPGELKNSRPDVFQM